MNCNEIVIAGVTCSGISGFPNLLLHEKSGLGQKFAVLLNVAGCMLGLLGVWTCQTHAESPALTFLSPVPGFYFTVALDGLSAFFLVPVCLVCGLASIYGVQYWRQEKGASNGRRVSVFLGLMTAGMMVVVVAADGLLFLFGWETMAISAMFLVATEDHITETCKAAWLYMAASHFATLSAFGVFAILYSQTGSFNYAVLSGTGSSAAVWMAVLGLIGFGTKAGIMPMHIWLPGAHAAAPSHVSAVMSGVMIKMGIYGMFRTASFFPHIPLSWGLVILAAGMISAVLGIAFAISQRDIKRLLAYSSIENIGIIVTGLGLALIGRATGHAEWVMLGMCGALLHVWNHSMFKSMLFLCAGSVVHSVETRQLDLMGGLGRRMPITATCFMIGAVAICGLPPLNGFVSELMIYLGLFQTIQTDPAGPVSIASSAAFAAPGLALAGALAVACFVKVYGIVFLGAARSEQAAHAHESGFAMTAPIVALAACCVMIGVVPQVAAPFVSKAASTWAAAEKHTGVEIAELSLATLAPLNAITIVAAVLISLLVVGTFLLLRRVRTSPSSLTWDCGYAAPSARMQYTSSSFAQWLVDLFGWALKPVLRRTQLESPFPNDAHFESNVLDTVLERIVNPATRFLKWLFGLSRYLQQGSLQAYLLYIFLIVLGLLLWRPTG